MTMVSTDYLRFVLALVLVLGLIALFAWLIKRFRIGAFAGGAGSGRLRVVDSLALDPRQRLVIIRRDDLEHLILIGPDGGRLIEGGIQAATGARLDHAKGEPGS